MAFARVYELTTPLFLPHIGKMDIIKVKVDQLTLPACMPCPLILVLNLDEENQDSVLTSLAIDILYFKFKIKWKMCLELS